MKKLFLFAFIALTITIAPSCKLLQPTQIVSPYNAAIVADVVDLGKFVDGFYSDMETDEDKSFTTSLPGYNAAEVSINSIIIRSSVRPKSGLIVKQAELYKKMLLKFRDEHKAYGTLNNNQIRIYRRYLADQLGPLLDSELSLKQKS